MTPLPDELLAAVARLHAAVPVERRGELVVMVSTLATRLEQLGETGEGAELEIAIRVSRGLWFEARWDGDVRLR